MKNFLNFYGLPLVILFHTNIFCILLIMLVQKYDYKNAFIRFRSRYLILASLDISSILKKSFLIKC